MLLIFVHSDRILLKGGRKNSGLESKEVDRGVEMRHKDIRALMVRGIQLSTREMHSVLPGKEMSDESHMTSNFITGSQWTSKYTKFTLCSFVAFSVSVVGDRKDIVSQRGCWWI